MIVLWIILAILALLVLLILFGSAKVHIVCREKLRIAVSVLGIRFTLISDKEKKEKPKKELETCHNPDKVLKKELKRQMKAAKKAEKKRLKALKKAEKKKALAASGKRATPNLKENLEMILALLKKLYAETRGNIKIRFRRMHIYVGSNDAAKTAILYGVIVQSVSYILNLVEEKFTHVKRRDGDVTVEPDYTSAQCSADIDLICTVKIRRAISMALSMLLAYNRERGIAYKKAALRERENRGKTA
ncbi:MAG: DUF2953 domain-containing protein [Clostridia bacterium]|nr:DUF2953 domain-containing protein [Clostridia bacterium]